MPRDIGAQLILAEWLFVETVADVRSRSSDPSTRTRYELLGIAPLLRKLLVDANPLLNTMRSARPEIPTNFRVRQWSAPAPDDDRKGGQFIHLLRLGGPELVGDRDVSPMPKGRQFIHAVVGTVQGRPLTVRDVVRYYANVEGGVHFGAADNETQQVLSEVAPLLLGQTTGQIEILAHIGAIVVDALTPLCESILTSPTIDTRLHRINDLGYFDGHWTADRYASLSQISHHDEPTSA